MIGDIFLYVAVDNWLRELRSPGLQWHPPDHTGIQPCSGWKSSWSSLWSSSWSSSWWPLTTWLSGLETRGAAFKLSCLGFLWSQSSMPSSIGSIGGWSYYDSCWQQQPSFVTKILGSQRKKVNAAYGVGCWMCKQAQHKYVGTVYMGGRIFFVRIFVSINSWENAHTSFACNA